MILAPPSVIEALAQASRHPRLVVTVAADKGRATRTRRKGAEPVKRASKE